MNGVKTPPMLWRTASACLTSLACLLLACGAGGCDAVGAFIVATHGPVDVDPLFPLPDRPTLVIVEDAAHVGLNELDADVVAKDLTDDLVENHHTDLVVSDKLQRLRDTDPPRYRALSISDLARLTGAAQVIYVDLQNSTSGLETTGSAAQGEASARVRVVEAATGVITWPVDQRLGYPVSAELRFNNVEIDRLTAQHAVLLDKLSTNIDHLFYAYQPDTDAGKESSFDSDAQLDVKKDM